MELEITQIHGDPTYKLISLINETDILLLVNKKIACNEVGKIDYSG